MDWGTAIIGLISILICIFPIVIMHYNRVKKENKMLQTLNENAQHHNCIISQSECCGNFVLGLDESRNFVFFFQQKKEDAVSEFVDLSEIQTCQVVKKTRNIKDDDENIAIIERVELSFIPENKSNGETRFEIFDAEINIQLNGELQLVDKWLKKINDHLRNKN